MEEEHGKGPAKASGDDEPSSGDDYDPGTRPHPYYGCTFCRRGFSNAQALGGHMNIHRKDRAKAQPPPPPPPPPPSPPPPAASSSASYSMHSPLAPSAEKTTARHLFGEDLRLGLSSSSTGGYRRHNDAAGAVAPPSGETRRQQEVDEDVCEVDLELRLGQQPHDERHAV